MILKINNIEIPRVQDYDTDHEIIGERERTAGGIMRQDVTAIKRQWSFSAGPMTQAEAAQVIDDLRTAMFTVADVEFDELGQTLTGYIDVSESITPFGDGAGWHTYGKTLDITVIER